MRLTQEHHSITKELAIRDKPYSVEYKLDGFLPEEFKIEVTSKQPQTHHKKLLLYPKGSITLSSNSIPEEVILEIWAPFSFIITNTSKGNVEYAIQITFEGVNVPNIYELPERVEDLLWTDVVAPTGSTTNEFVVMLPSEALPEGIDEAGYNIYLKLYARAA